MVKFNARLQGVMVNDLGGAKVRFTQPTIEIDDPWAGDWAYSLAPFIGKKVTITLAPESAAPTFPGPSQCALPFLPFDGDVHGAA